MAGARRDMTGAHPMTKESTMNTSPAPDVDRVLAKMGRAAFGYRSFPRPVEELASPGPEAEDRPVVAPAAPVVVRAVRQTEPQREPARAEAAPVAAPANPFLRHLPATQALGVGITPLALMFRVLSGPAPAGRCTCGRGAPSFPFRRG
jgi:hypothetical protein